jgi:Mrp family chromosome partitioning ATPase
VSQRQSAGFEPEVGAVAFVPLASRPAPVPRRPVHVPGMPVVNVLLRALGQPLADVARRARRLGPLNGGAVVLLTGCGRGVGCSTVSLGLAAAATGERSVLLVDGDLGQAGLSRSLGPCRFDWEQVVRGLCSLAQALRHPDREGILSFLPLHGPVGDPDALLKHSALPAWLARLRREYGLIVLDGGDVEHGGVRWAPFADAALLVCEPGKTEAADWARGWDHLEEGGTSVMGVIETFVDDGPPAGAET